MEPTSLAATSAGIGLQELIRKADFFAQAARAASSRRARESDMADFESWARRQGLWSEIPAPQVIGLYLADRASSLAPQTLTRRLTSITQSLRARGYDGPSPASTRNQVVGAVLKGIRRIKGVKPGPNQKDPLLTNQIRLLVASCGDDLQGARDRALILVGYAGGGIRRANLAGIDAASLEFCDEGLIYHQGRSKTDQEGVGRKVGIPWGSDAKTCPVRVLRHYLALSSIVAGPVFRAVRWREGRQVVDGRGLNPASVNYIVKRLARRAGLDAEAVGNPLLASTSVPTPASGLSFAWTLIRSEPPPRTVPTYQMWFSGLIPTECC